MATSLVTHCGAVQVSRQQLDVIDPPPATDTWFPLKHSFVLETVQQALGQAGFEVRHTKLAVTRNGSRFFGTLDLAASLGTGVHLAVGIRNSVDKSLPIGFCAGSKVFVCDNLAFRSEVVIARKHTKFGADRFAEALTKAVGSLQQFRDVETERIKKMQFRSLNDDAAALYCMQAFDREIVSHTLLRRIWQQWQAPTMDWGEKTVWRLLNAFTWVLSDRAKSNPQRHAHDTIRVQALLDEKPAPEGVWRAAA